MASEQKDIASDTKHTEFDIEWIFLESYLFRIEEYLHDEQETYDDFWLGGVEELSDEQQEEAYAKDVEQHLLNTEFPKFLRNSFFALAYSLLEHHIEIISSMLRNQQNIPISIYDLRGSMLNKAKLFWKLANIELPKDIWVEVSNYSEVRQCIVHDNTIIKEDCNYFNKLKDFAKKKNLIRKRDETIFIVLTKDFCLEAVHSMKNLIDILYQSIQSKKQQR
jgi:hypothetical protein